MTIRILIVDDDRDLLSLIQRFLVSEYPEFEILSAVSAQDALRIMETGEIDAIVCDFYLGPKEMNGLELLEWLRSSGSTLPFVMFTGRSREEVAIRALNLGADFYLKKDIEDFENLFKELVHHLKNAVETRKMEDALKESESRFRAIFEQAPIGVARIDLDGRILEGNTSLAYMLGYEVNELVGINFFEITNEEDRVKEEYLRNEMLSGIRDSYQMEKRFFCKDGEMIWSRLSVSPVLNVYGQPIFTIGMLEDITEKKQDREALRESEERFRALYEGAGTGIFVTNQSYQIIDVNPAFEQLTGYNRKESLNMTLSNFSHTEDLDLDELLREAFESGRDTFSLVKRYVRKDGAVIWGRLSVSLVRNEANEFHLMYGIIEDVTDQAISAEAIRESEEKFRSVFEESAIANNLYDSDGLLIDANIAGLELAGVTSVTDILGINLFEDPNLPEDAKERILKGETVRFLSNYDFDKVTEFSLYSTTKSGIAYIDTVVAPYDLDHHGAPKGYFVQMQDVTEKKLAEDEILKNQDLFRSTIESTAHGILVTSSSQEVLHWNSRFGEMWGIPEAEIENVADDSNLIGYVLNGLEDPDGFVDRVNEIYHLNEQVFDIIRLKDNRVFERLSSPLIQSGKNVGRVWTFRDVTALKLTEDALLKSEEKYRTLVEHLPVVAWTADFEGKSVYVSPNIENVYGFTPEELLNGGSDIWFGRIHEEDREGVREHYAKSFERNEGYDIEYRIKRKDGKWIWLHDWSTGTYLKDGKKVSSGVFEDITNRKLIEDTLLTTQENLQAIVDNSPDIISLLDAEANVIFVNRTVPELEDETVLGRSIYDLRSPEEADRLRSYIELVTKTKESVEYQIEYDDAKVGKIYFNIRVKPVLKNNEIVGFTINLQDVTASSLANQRIRAERDRAERYLDIVGSMVVSLDLDGKVTLINRKGCEILGHNAEDIVGKNWFEHFIPSRIKAQLQDVHAKSRSGKIGDVEEYENPILTKDGQEKILLWRNVELSDEDGTIIGTLSSGIDISDRKIAEDSLRESEEKFRAIFEKAGVGIVFLDIKQNILDANEASQKLLGYSHDELTQMHLKDISHPEDIVLDSASMQGLLEGDYDHFSKEKRYIRKDGSFF
ncbi:MAG: PAS domain S-box protein, partial [Candidatus Thorarchaeota archaeon]